MNFAESLASQARACEKLGSPFMARLMRLLQARLKPGSALTDRMFAWPGDTSGTGDAVALRLAGALHTLVLDGSDPDLAIVYPPNSASDDALFAAVTGAMERHEARIDSALNAPPQTNEIRRSASLIAIGHWLSARFDKPLVLSEIGASAGLNLNWDKFRLNPQPNGPGYGPETSGIELTPEWQGDFPPIAIPKVQDRRGVDLKPFDLSDQNDQIRLLSYLWPDQTHRLNRTRAALTLPTSKVDQADAVDWLESRLVGQTPGACHMIYSTIAWQYLPSAAQARGEALIRASGALATADAPLAWFRMEPDGVPDGAGMLLQLWPGDVTLQMGRIDFHGQWVKWNAPKPDASLLGARPF